MKNIIKALAISAVLITASVGFTGCGESNTAPTQPTTVAEPTTAVATVASAPQESFTTVPANNNYLQQTTSPNSNNNSSAKQYNSLQEFVNAPEAQIMMSAMQNSTVSAKMYAEGDVLVLEMTYKIDLTKNNKNMSMSDIKKMLDATFSTDAYKTQFKTMLDAIKIGVNVQNPSLRIDVFNSDGTKITEIKYDSANL